MNINLSGRELWIDYLKVIAIFLIVFNHLVGYQYAEFFSSAYNIFHLGIVGHVALFWFCSGYLYKKIDVKDSIKKYFPRLIVPYLFFNFIGIFMGIILKHWKDFYIIIFSKRVFHYLLDYKVLSGIFLLYPNNRNAYMNSPTWFLVSLFIILVLFTILVKYTKNEKQLGISIFLLQVLNFGLVKFQVPSYFTINASLLGLCFFYVGYLFKKYNWKSYFDDKKYYLRNIVLMIILLASSIILFKSHYHFWFFGGSSSNNFILAYISTFSFMFFFIILTLMIHIESKLIYLVSINTLVVMGFDQYLRGYIKLILQFTGVYPHVNVFIIFINAVVIVLISTLFGIILTKYVPFLVGKSAPKSK